MSVRIQYRRDLSATWSSVNPILAEGEPGYEVDTGKFKVGDGIHAWVDLVYSSGLQGPEGPTGLQGPEGPQGIQGESGPQGIQGDAGLQGDVGPQGPQGIQGEQGLQGVQGDTGLQGDVGPQGPQGPDGAQGLQGEQGLQGPQGVQGPAGNLDAGSPIVQTELTDTPPAPPAGSVSFYPKDGKFYKMTSDGVEEELGTGSGFGGNADGGTPDSVYGGITSIDAGVVQ